MTDLPDGVLLMSPIGEVLWANHAAEQIFQMTFVEAIERGITGLDLLHPDDLALAHAAMTSVQNKEVGTPIEMRVKTPDGWCLCEMVGATKDYGIVLVIRDITYRRRWEIAHDQEARFRALVSNSDVLTLLMTADGLIEQSSVVVTRLLGHDQETIEGMPFEQIVSEEDRPAWRELLHFLVSGHGHSAESESLDLELLAADGRHVPFLVTVKNLLDDQSVAALVLSGHDISDRVAVERALRGANSVLAATFESSADGICVTSPAGEITMWNRRFLEVWGFDREVLYSSSRKELLKLFTSQLADPDEFLTSFNDLSERPDAELSDELHFADGRRIERITVPQRVDGEVVGRVWCYRDVTERRQLHEQLTRQAFHDSLTGLANRTLFRQRVELAIGRFRPADAPVAVLFIDLDDFKTVNDSLGHLVGDEMLISVSNRLNSCLRSTDTAARLGGDEFAVLIEDLHQLREATIVAERIVAVLDEPMLIAGRWVSASASIGVAYGDRTMSVSDLLRNADLAMYTAKKQGKSCYRVYEPEMHSAALERLEVEATLRGAAARGELFVEFQPIYDTRSGEMVEAEALVRWNHPERGLLGPGAFIPQAESTGVIEEVGEFVLRESLRWVREWGRDLGLDAVPAVNVNLSPRQLNDPRLPERVFAVLSELDLPASKLVLEITESAIMGDPEQSRRILERISALGVRLAVDDFGTGYSSLAYLQQFPIAFLKIDGSFVQQMLVNEGASMVEAVTQLAHTLGLTPVAEGVESEAQLREVVRIGVDLAQGYHLSRPVSPDALFALLKSQRRSDALSSLTLLNPPTPLDSL